MASIPPYIVLMDALAWVCMCVCVCVHLGTHVLEEQNSALGTTPRDTIHLVLQRRRLSLIWNVSIKLSGQSTPDIIHPPRARNQTHNTMAEALKIVGLGAPACPHSCTVETSLPWLSPQQSSFIFVQLEMGSYNSDPYFSDLGLIQEFGVLRVKWVWGCWNGVHRICTELIVSSGSCGNPDHSFANPHKVLLWIKLCFLLKGC